MNWLLVIAGGGRRAPVRYLTDRAVQSRHDSVFPWGTFTSTWVGAAGFPRRAPGGRRGAALLGTGFCGALTTYSTFAYETLRLAEEGAGLFAALNVAANMAAGLAAAGCGMSLARLLAG